jgi:UDP-N-acetylmuramate dehydrogenase
MFSHSVRDKLLHNHKLLPYTSWKIGGAAEYFYRPSGLDDLINLLKTTSSKFEKITILGGGSNVLIRDGGINGLVIHLANTLNQITITDNSIIDAEAGINFGQLMKKCLDLGMVEAAFMAGIPGTLGGALMMNAGAHDNCIWNHVRTVTTINQIGEIKIRDAAEFHSSYRKVDGLQSGEWFLAASLEFTPGDKNSAWTAARKHLWQRQQSQPLDLPSCGSVFCNPEGDYAARLIELCGFKGKILGGAQVSEKHANFILNFNGASSNDVENLMEEIIERVRINFGITLAPEVHVIGKT